MKKNILLIVLTAFALVSCGSSKDFVYFQDMAENQKYEIAKMPPTKIHVGDRLSIIVNSKSPELAVPFNIQSGMLQFDNVGNVSEAGTSQTTSSATGGYLVDQEGYITFPILGRIYVADMTLAQVSDRIKSKIVEGGYINDPYVSTELINFKYTVLGAAGTGVFTSENGDKVTILDAVAKSGDVAVNGKVDNVMVIREVNGNRVVYKMDLRSKNLFDSPAYYLQQNDIVYVEPKYRGQEAYMKTYSRIQTGLSFVTSISTIVILMISLNII